MAKPNYRPPRLTLPVGERDHVEGPSSAPMVLVEYGDYQCPYCGAAYPIVKKVQKELGTRLRFVFRNFTITPPTRKQSGPRKPPRRPPSKGGSGRCMIFFTRIKHPWPTMDSSPTMRRNSSWT